MNFYSGASEWTGRQSNVGTESSVITRSVETKQILRRLKYASYLFSITRNVTPKNGNCHFIYFCSRFYWCSGRYCTLLRKKGLQIADLNFGCSTLTLQTRIYYIKFRYPGAMVQQKIGGCTEHLCRDGCNFVCYEKSIRVVWNLSKINRCLYAEN